MKQNIGSKNRSAAAASVTAEGGVDAAKLIHLQISEPDSCYDGMALLTCVTGPFINSRKERAHFAQSRKRAAGKPIAPFLKL
jgi:hypothetical protein